MSFIKLKNRFCDVYNTFSTFLSFIPYFSYPFKIHYSKFQCLYVEISQEMTKHEIFPLYISAREDEVSNVFEPGCPKAD